VRVLIVDTWYQRVLDTVYGEQQDLAEASYDEQWRTLMSTCFGTADSYSHHLGELGHSAHEVIANCEPLQAAWLRENSKRARPPRIRRIPQSDLVVLAQAAAFDPDVVYLQNLVALAPATLRRLRRNHLVVGQIASELPDPGHLRLYDLVLTSLPHFVDRLRGLGVRSEYLRIAFDARVLDRLGERRPAAGAVFVGSLARFQHGRGNEVLEQAAALAPVAFYGPGADDWPADSPIRREYRGEAWGLDMYRVLAGASIALNRHIGVAEEFANNMRLYEATGVRTLLLTDAKRNLHELFEPDAEVVTYASAQEAADKIRYYLEHEDERTAIARAGQARTLAEHTYAHRMRELEQILNRYTK